jgi:REP element-mobilizing transposase RayT
VNQCHRHSIRLKDYDYAQAGVYFVTLCTYRRECLFGDVDDAAGLALSAIGRIVEEEWQRSALIRGEIELDAFVVMPNHVHGIVVITPTAPNVGEACVEVWAHGCAPISIPRRPRSLGAFVAGFKSAVTTRANTMAQTPGRQIWQRNYYEHIIHNARELDAVREYIVNNPLKWSLDRENPLAQTQSPAGET